MKYDMVKLKELCTVNQGLQIPISERFKEPGENRYFYITVQFLKESGENYYIEKPPKSVTCTEDEILVVRTGNTGQVITGVAGCFHNNFFKVTPNERIFPKYLYYALNNKKMHDAMLNAASGTTIPDLKHSSFYDLEIPLPKIETQKKIAKILNNICNKLELNNEINNNLHELNKQIYKENVEKIRFDYPDDYFKSLDEVTNLNSRGISPSYISSKNGIPVINQSCIRNDIIKEEKIQYHDNAKKVDDKFFYKNYDILINSMGVGTLGRISQIGKLTKKYLIHSCISIIRADESKINQFVLGQEIINMQFDIENMAHGSTGQTSLSNKELGKKIIFVPPMKIQLQISEILKSNIDKISTNLIENEKLEQLRDTLLPKLMNGEIDLDNIEI